MNFQERQRSRTPSNYGDTHVISTDAEILDADDDIVRILITREVRSLYPASLRACKGIDRFLVVN